MMEGPSITEFGDYTSCPRIFGPCRAYIDMLCLSVRAHVVFSSYMPEGARKILAIP